MKPGGPKNIVASIQARLVQRSHELDVEHQLTLARFGGERLLYRLSKSEFADRFILKGAAPPSGASLTVPRPLRIELKGNLAAMLGAAQNAKRSPETGDLSLQVVLVAGARCRQCRRQSTSWRHRVPRPIEHGATAAA